MTDQAPHVPVPARSTRSWMPLLACWLIAAWPFVLWLVHRSDPVLAVRFAAGASRTLWTMGLWSLAAGGVLMLVFPPAPAWFRLVGSRIWRSLTTDRAPLQRALAELQHFETATRHLEVGRLARLGRDPATALRHLQRAVMLDPEVPSAHHQYGLVAFALRHFDVAAACFATAERLEPGHAFGDALLHLGRSQFRLGNAAAAATTLRLHQQRHGGGPKSHLWLAEALLATGDHDGAGEALRTAAAPPAQRLIPEENWCRALARVRLWRHARRP